MKASDEVKDQRSDPAARSNEAASGLKTAQLANAPSTRLQLICSRQRVKRCRYRLTGSR